MKKYILAFDIGTTSTRALLFDKSLRIAAIEQEDIISYYPEESWVEQCPDDLFNITIKSAQELLKKNDIKPAQIAAIGITNQRETTILWDKNTGKPVYNAIVWQDKRTTKYCQELKNEGYARLIHKKTGLHIDPYFSATKVKWMLDNISGLRSEAENGNILMGTVDTWFLWKLTNGKNHSTDISNASRTMLFNISSLCWDDYLLNLFKIPKQILPNVISSSGKIATTDAAFFDGISIPVCGIAGDQQAALFGQHCFEKGMIKNTYGTGCFILMNCGKKPVFSKNGLITTVAWGINNEIYYAIEGSVFYAGAVIKWLRDVLGLIKSAADTEKIASEQDRENEVYFVPCFTGLGAPYWNMNARGIITGLSVGSSKGQIVKAALDSLAYQSTDVIKAMQLDLRYKIKQLNVDGGAAVNNYLMQFQSDILNAEVIRPTITESTALGVAMLAGLGVGFWQFDDLKKGRSIEKTFKPQMSDNKRKELYEKWQFAVYKANMKRKGVKIKF